MITLVSCQVSTSLDIGKLRKRAGSIKSWKTKMAMRFYCRASEASETLFNRERHCSIENRGYIYYGMCNFSL